jgi:hypothetical protein
MSFMAAGYHVRQAGRAGPDTGSADDFVAPSARNPTGQLLARALQFPASEIANANANRRSDMASKHNRSKKNRNRKSKRGRGRGGNRASMGALFDRQAGMINRWATDDDSPRNTCLRLNDETEEVAFCDSTETKLALAGDQAGEQWLWCLHCERFFQAKHLKLDFLGNYGQCPFDDCGAAGLDIDIFSWDECRDDPEWPTSVEELSHGMRFPPSLLN